MTRKTFKLITEAPSAMDFSSQIECVQEKENRDSPKEWFVQGPFMQHSIKNRNGRIYQKDEMIADVERYVKERVERRNAYGALEHPESSEITLDNACHLITNLHAEGNLFVGKAKLLETPKGKLVKGIIKSGGAIGMSTRALGQVHETNEGSMVTDFNLVAVDCVADPSCTSAYVDGILESKQFIIAADGKTEEFYDEFEGKIGSIPAKEREAYLRESIMKFINKL